MPGLVDTHEIDAIEVSAAAHAEISLVLIALGRDSRFHPSDCGVLVDLTGLGLVVRRSNNPAAIIAKGA